MALKLADRNDYANNVIFSYISILWEIVVETYHYLTGQAHRTLSLHQTTVQLEQRRRHIKYMCTGTILVMIAWLFFIANLVASSLLAQPTIFNDIEPLHPGHDRDSRVVAQDPSSRYIYIDIGCFNAETVEHFLHFTLDSVLYEIYTFEPDPDNYRLCKKRLSAKKFAKYNINVIRKVAWIRDETVYFQAERGRQSRISLNATEDDGEALALEAIDFSSWLVQLVGSKKAHVHIKMSMPGAEVPVLEKMILDETLGLADRYEVEWTDRENPKIRATRIYIQLMFDSYGFDCLYYTRLQNIRKVFKMKGAMNEITKYYDWQKISEFDALAHYSQRLDVP